LYKKNVLRGGLLNLIPFAGVGSWAQRDYLGGGITVWGQVAGAVTFVVGTFMFIIPIIMIAPILSSEGQQFMENGMTTMAVGGITTGVFYLFGIVRGFCYPAAYNRKLETALYGGKAKLDVEPSVNITGRGVELAFSIKF
jgi:hypothetical protein